MPRIDELSTADRRRVRTGRPSLDFSHTGGEGEAAVWEVLHTPSDLGRWLAVVLDLPDDVPTTEADMAQAVAVRNALARVARGLAAGGSPAVADVAIVNAAAAVPALVPQWAPPGDRHSGAPRPATGDVRWAYPAGVSPAAAALSSLARDAVDLFTGPLAGRIRICSSEQCGLLYVDASRPGTRRWCSMSRCGNLAKVRRHRGR